MIAGIMQPYFLPYPGYLDLVNRADRWIVFDTPQYIRHGWVNRNRILRADSGWQYVTVPVQKRPRGTAIRDVPLVDGTAWQDRIRGQLGHYRKRAPRFDEVQDLLDEVFSFPARTISDLNVHALGVVCRHLGIDTPIERFSAMDLSIEATDAGDWAREISRAIGADTYVNPPGGAAIFDEASFAEAGIELVIQQYEPLSYETPGYSFEPNLSIIDVLMWCNPDDVRRHLDQQPQRRLLTNR